MQDFQHVGCRMPVVRLFSPNFTLHISHLRLVHSSDPSFNFVCSVRGCMHTGVFKAFSAYSSHVYRHHRVALGLEMFSDSGNTIPSGESSVGEVQPVDATSATNFGTDDDATSVHEGRHEVAPVLRDSGPSLQTINAAKFLLRLREGHSVSQVTLTDVMGSCHEMCTYMVNCFKQEICEICVQANLDTGTIQGLENVLSRQPPHPFEAVNTTYRFEKFYVDHFSCLVSFTVLLCL